MDLSKKHWQWILLILLSAMWGTSFILMKHGVQSYSPSQVAAMRMFFAFIFFIPFIIKKIRKLKKKHILSLLLVAFIGNAIPSFLFTTAQFDGRVSSSLAGMLNAITPLFVWLAGITIYKVKTKWINVVGILIGLLGSLGLVIKDVNSIFSGISIFALLIVLATLFYGISTNEVKVRLKKLDGISITAFTFLFVGPPAGLYLLFQDYSHAIATPNHVQNLLFVVLLAFFSSFLAVTIFNILIKHTSAIFAASVTYIIPFFAVLWGLADGETITVYQIISMVIVLTGVYLVNKK